MSSLATTPPVSVGTTARRASATSATPLAAAASSFREARSFSAARGPLPAGFSSGASSSSRPPAVVVPPALTEAATTTVGFSAPMRAAPCARGPALASPSAAKGLLSSALEGQEGGAGAPSAPAPLPPQQTLLSPKTSLFADPTGRSSRIAHEAATLEAAIDAAAARFAGLASAADDADATAAAEAAAATRTVDLSDEQQAAPSTPAESDTPEALLAAAQRRHPEVFGSPGVAAALRLAARLHANAPARASGEPLIAHCVAVATILAELGLGEDLVAAGLLHDALGPRSSLVASSSSPAAASSAAAAAAQLVAGAGDPSCSVAPGVAALVERVERLNEASRLYRDNAHAIAAAQQLDLLTGVDDAAALLIKLADRLADMRTLSALPRARQVRLARETAGVHAVLASRLGAWRVKAELEDLSFAALQPEQHAAAAQLVAARAEAADLPTRVREAQEALSKAGVEVVDISGRVKHARGAAKKLGRGKALDDVAALRVVVKGKHDCYTALRALETLAWPGASVPGRFKDYIRERKANGYQSLHYVVELPSAAVAAGAASADDDGAAGSASSAAASTVRFEVQIRTPKMHYLAEYGMAAHWRYKEAGGAALDSADGSPSGSGGAARASPSQQQGRLPRGSNGSGGSGGSGGHNTSASDPKAAADRAEWLDRLVQWKRWVVAHKLGLATESGKARAAMLAGTEPASAADASADAAAASLLATSLSGPATPAVGPDAALRALGLPSVLDAETCPHAAASVDPLLLNERFRVRPVTEGDAAARPVPVLVSGPRGARVVELPARTTAAQLLRAAVVATPSPPRQLELPEDATTAEAAAALERVLVSPAAAAAAAQQRARLAAAASGGLLPDPSSSISSRPASAGGPVPPRLSRPRVAVLVNGVAIEAGSAAADAPLRAGDLVTLVAPHAVGAAPPQRPAYAAAAAAAAVPATAAYV